MARDSEQVLAEQLRNMVDEVMRLANRLIEEYHCNVRIELKHERFPFTDNGPIVEGKVTVSKTTNY